MTNFHLTQQAYTAVAAKKMRDVVVAIRNDCVAGDVIRLVSDDTRQACQTTVVEVTPFKRSDTMTLTISACEDIDYAICA